MSTKPHIAIPEPTSFDTAYNQRGWPQYALAVELSGGVPVPVPLNESQATVARIVQGCAGILLPGSPADLDPQKYGEARVAECADPDPARESVDDLLLQEAFNLRKPILGICYGLQSVNVWCNGSLRQHIPGTGVDHAPGRDVHEAHALTVEEGTQLAQIIRLASGGSSGGEDSGAIRVNSSHHQAVGVAGDGLLVAARSQDDGVIEAVEGQSREQFVLGVQWHPERTFAVQHASRAIFEAFVEAARSWKVRPILESIAQPASGPGSEAVHAPLAGSMPEPVGP